ncbi:MAG: hypothetical protein JWQ73_3263 [Variovorax sp.]|nr:hypothetical protein [Variovorax sp.]
MEKPDTQQKSKLPMSEASRTASGSFQWKLEKNEDEKTPIFHYNNLSVHICGEDSFKRIAQDIRDAEESIDIAFWGFDPAMELVRKPGPWRRGDTWGELLRDAAEGKLKNKKKVQVRLLVWWDAIGAALSGSNMPGYKQDAPFELRGAAAQGAAAAVLPRSERTAPPQPTTPQDKREVFNSNWFRDAAAGKIEGLSLRTRGGVHADVVASLKAENKDRNGPALGGVHSTERLGLELMATHHQKTIVIDYDGPNPRAYVMGLNSVTDYWDTVVHGFNDAQRGELFEGGSTDHSAGKGWDKPTEDKTVLKPFQDYVCRVQGGAVEAVCKNFTEAWNKAKVEGKGGGSNLSRSFNLKKPPSKLTAKLNPNVQRAQILRTLPSAEGSERSIERMYYQASSFARHYLYVENQYFQNTDWAHALKETRKKFVDELGKARPPVPLADVPVLHVMIVTPTPERGQMVPRTHDILAELGHGDSMPNQDKSINEELDNHARAEQAAADYKTRRAAYDTGRLAGPPPVFPRPAPPLSDLARSHKDAGATKDSQAAREKLSTTLGLRSLVASLWTYDKEWSLGNTSVAQKAGDEQRRYGQQKKEWDRYQTSRSDAKARDIAAGGWGSSMDTRQPPVPPPDRSKQIQDATARRYREIYIHSKLMVIDDSMFTLGSANLNLRSFAVDSEMNIASDDAPTAKDLRQRVWAQHTEGKFMGGEDATEQKGMKETFKSWNDEAAKNFERKKSGESLSCFLVKFYDERTSSVRLG